MSYDETMSAIDEALDDSWEWGGDAARWRPDLEHDVNPRQGVRYHTEGDTLRAEWREPVDLTEYLRAINQMVIQVAERQAIPLDLLVEWGSTAPRSTQTHIDRETFDRLAVGSRPNRLWTEGYDLDFLVFDEVHLWTEANPAWEGLVEQIRQRAEQPGSRCISVTNAGE